MGTEGNFSKNGSTFKLVDFNNFIRTNTMSDKFVVKGYHHIEFWCSDATNVACRFSLALGIPIVQKSDLSTGNTTHASYLLRSGQINLLFTAPYSPSISTNTPNASIPTFSRAECNNFTSSHGLAVRSIAVEVEDAKIAYSISVAHGAKPLSNPVTLGDKNDVVMSEVKLYGDVVLRYISYKNQNHSDSTIFLPGFEPIEKNATTSFQEPDHGLFRFDHVVGNVPELGPAVDYVKSFTGFHEFSIFTAKDIGTAESGLNSVVLSSNSEAVLISMSEPVHGTKRQSQIQTYLEHNQGAGVQHFALASKDIFRTLREMRERSGVGGFEFMPSPPPTYYRNLKKRAGDVLTDEQINECQELGILVDKDDQGTLLQIFTKPIGDRPTIFIEIIQRVGCMLKDDEGKFQQKAGCGGFGKGNFTELFKSVEEYEKLLEARITTLVHENYHHQ